MWVEDGGDTDESANFDGLGSGRKQIDDVAEDCEPPTGCIRVMVAVGVSGTSLQVIAFKSMTLASGETIGDKAAGIPSSNSNGGSSLDTISGFM